ncbi:MAG: DUF7146 domain-containing protein [Gallionella sp.]
MESKELKKLAAHRWESIVLSLAPSLAQAAEKVGHHVSCPVHGGADGFRLFKDFNETGGGVCNTCGIKHDGYSLIMWANGWDFFSTYTAIHNLLLGGGNNPPPKVIKPKEVEKELKVLDIQEIRDSLNHVWKNSVPLASQEAWPARLYFKNRGINIDCQKLDSLAIRFVSELEYYEDGKMTGKYPAIITMVSDASGRPSTIHRTYLTIAGTKAPVQSSKKMMRHCADNLFGAMRLTEGVGSVIAVTEGIETALAIMGACDMPVWAAGNAYLLEHFAPPVGFDVVIYADKDRPSSLHPEGHGLEAAKSLAKRLRQQGVKVSIQLPAEDIPQGMKSVDWLDVLGNAQNIAHNQVDKIAVC